MEKYLTRMDSYRKAWELIKALMWVQLLLLKMLLIWVQLVSHLQ